ncbi:MAG: hypothetical protein ACK5IC_05460, partial [Moheibacter sp.]
DAVAAVYTGGASLAASGLKTGGKKLGKEVVEEIGEQAVKNTDDALEAGGKKGVKEGLEEAVEQAGKKGPPGKVVTRDINWELIRKYIKSIEEITNRAVHPKQIDELKNALRNKKYEKLTPEKTLKKRAEFNKKRKELIEKWEKETGQEWPKYEETIYDKNGEPYRKAGDKYDAHHIIENNFGGDDKWWNLHPAKSPSEHQGGIHGSGSPSRELFK